MAVYRADPEFKELQMVIEAFYESLRTDEDARVAPPTSKKRRLEEEMLRQPAVVPVTAMAPAFHDAEPSGSGAINDDIIVISDEND